MRPIRLERYPPSLRIMRAIQVDRYGGPEVLEVAGVADPVAGPRQVVVEVAAADVLFLDCQIRGGWGEMFGAHVSAETPGAIAWGVSAETPAEPTGAPTPTQWRDGRPRAPALSRIRP